MRSAGLIGFSFVMIFVIPFVSSEKQDTAVLGCIVLLSSGVIVHVLEEIVRILKGRG